MSVAAQQLASSDEKSAQSAHKISDLLTELETVKRLLNDEQQARVMVEKHARLVNHQLEALEAWIDEHDYATLQRKMTAQGDMVGSSLQLICNLHCMKLHTLNCLHV